jgi:hypothetical protein
MEMESPFCSRCMHMPYKWDQALSIRTISEKVATTHIQDLLKCETSSDAHQKILDTEARSRISAPQKRHKALISMETRLQCQTYQLAAETSTLGCGANLGFLVFAIQRLICHSYAMMLKDYRKSKENMQHRALSSTLEEMENLLLALRPGLQGITCRQHSQK